MDKYLEFDISDDKTYINEELDKNYSKLGTALKGGLMGAGLGKKSAKKVQSKKSNSGLADMTTGDKVRTGLGNATRRAGNFLRGRNDKESERVKKTKARPSNKSTGTGPKNPPLTGKEKRTASRNRRKFLKKEGITSQQEENRFKVNKKIDAVDAKRLAKTGRSKVGGAVVGGAVGLGAGHLLVKKSRKELATLTAKPNKTEQDLARIKKLKRKVNLAKGVGAVAGAGVGAYAGNKLRQRSNIKKNYTKSDHSFVKSGSYKAGRQKTSLD